MSKKEFIDRWNNLGEKAIAEALVVAAPKYSPERYLKELILEEENEHLANKRLSVLESILIKDEEEQVEIKINQLKPLRDQYLRDTDHSQLADAPYSSEEKKLYRRYRHYLRELPLVIRNGHSKGYEVVSFKEWKEDQIKFPNWDVR